jgi:transposase|tara:strand:- start:11 stop:1429 length:1419 start_codon:yes stop_codon:yes gene_type:complete
MQATAEPLKTGVLGASLTELRAREIFRMGEEAVVFALLAQAQALGSMKGTNKPAPSAPSGSVPPHEKPATKGKRNKKPGRKRGHKGVRRSRPDRIDQTKNHRLKACPDCGGRLNRCNETRTRYTEDIPQDIKPVVTEHIIHRDWCSGCQKHVEPKITDVLPGSQIGNRVLVLTAWLHYGLGTTISQIVEIFNGHLQMPLTPGGLVQMWQRLAELLYTWYEQIQQEAMGSAILHADETGWRVNGKTHWLWCFTNQHLTYYMIDRSRGSPALMKFFTEAFEGTLVSDFWGAYNAVHCESRQMCLVHLLRDLENVEQYHAVDKDWPAFAKKLRRLIHDAMRLSQRDPSERASRRLRLQIRLQMLIDTEWKHSDARRLIKRLRRHSSDLFTFLDYDNVPSDNNHAERAIRPAVIIRKNSQSNRSERGADTQAILMSVYRTLKQRGHQPLNALIEALQTYLRTGQMPALPANLTPDG